ncbi:hypothetical protein AB9P05_14205 [Roseivirga sp. BDSF3-8]|uniref:hypothetical protein n=1 Tax=Roseivirga sp. BDSF3-8 TaxID=3241598 RepID=UPI003532510B
MKKQKLSLNALTLSSFVTQSQQKHLAGGAKTDYKQCGTGYETINSCNTDYAVCGTGPV